MGGTHHLHHREGLAEYFIFAAVNEIKSATQNDGTVLHGHSLVHPWLNH